MKLGTLSDVSFYVSRLRRGNGLNRSFIVRVSETGDFLTIHGDEFEVIVEFSLATDRQRIQEKAFREVAEKADVELIELSDGKGNSYLDVFYGSSERQINEFIETIMLQVFGAKPESSLEFETMGIEKQILRSRIA